MWRRIQLQEDHGLGIRFPGFDKIGRHDVGRLKVLELADSMAVVRNGQPRTYAHLAPTLFSFRWMRY